MHHIQSDVNVHPKMMLQSTGGSDISSRSVASFLDASSTVTRPENFFKIGTVGNVIPVITNYFEMNKRPSFTLHQYRVDFKPEEDNTTIKKMLVKAHSEALGSLMFGGHTMYRTEELSPELCSLDTENANGQRYTMSIRLVGYVNLDDPMYLQFYNIVMRNCMGHLDMEELGRHFYDRHSKVSITNQTEICQKKTHKGSDSDS